MDVRTAVPPAPDVVESPRPRSRLARAGHALADWARGSSGRLVLPAVLVSATLVLAGVGGGVLVPGLAAKATPPHPPAATTAGDDQSDPPGEVPPTTAAPQPPEDNAAPDRPAGTGRPPDALSGWAAPLAAKLGIPVVALQAYGYAELATAGSQPSCHLHWTTLAGIGKVESNHGQAHATLSADGFARPPIIGAALDGKDGRIQLTDTDRGRLDGDTTWDHAVGPMQFIPLTWNAWAVDGDNDGQSDPNDINDAALAAARYLCAGGRDMSSPDGWWAGMRSYNALQSYAQDVFDAANDYGIRSRR